MRVKIDSSAIERITRVHEGGTIIELISVPHFEEKPSDKTYDHHIYVDDDCTVIVRKDGVYIEH